MTQVVNNDKLNLILTRYGLNRIAEAVATPTLNLNITKIKLGSGDNYEYYVPSEDQEELKGPLDLEFYIFDKALLEDEVTVSFHTIIPEGVGGIDIREVGLYETVNGEDKLFAISTQQPFVKPSTEDNYFINIDYYVFLKEVNFAEVYDQIVLDTSHALVTEPNLEELMRTFVFAHGNLINQIGNNSRIIGYNRPTQLYEKITENKTDFGYVTLYKNYASLMDMVEDPSNIFSFWAFNYSRRRQVNAAIVDISSHSYDLSTNRAANTYKRTYEGMMSMFSFEGVDNYKLSSQIPLNLYNVSENIDSPFTMMFAINPLVNNVDRTLIAKSDYATHTHALEVTELATGALRVRLFSDASNYLTFTSAAGIIPFNPHSVVITYNPYAQTITAFINSNKYNMEKVETGTYTHMNETPGVLYCYSKTPVYTVWTEQTPTNLRNSDGSPYSGANWRISDNKVYYGNTEIEVSSTTTETDDLYAWIPTGPIVYANPIYTKTETIGSDTVLYNENYEVQTSGPYTVVDLGGGDGVILYNNGETERDPESDIDSITLYEYIYEEDVQKIWTNSTSQPTSLYNIDGSIYTGTAWTTSNNKVYYDGQQASTDSSSNISTYMPDLASYIINSNGSAAENIKAKVGLISIIKEELSVEYARALALTLCATLGRNPYLNGN